MIEFSLCCDECGAIINASRHSAARARDEARQWCNYSRLKRRDICHECIAHLKEPKNVG